MGPSSMLTAIQLLTLLLIRPGVPGHAMEYKTAQRPHTQELLQSSIYKLLSALPNNKHNRSDDREAKSAKRFAEETFPDDMSDKTSTIQLINDLAERNVHEAIEEDDDDVNTLLLDIIKEKEWLKASLFYEKILGEQSDKIDKFRKSLQVMRRQLKKTQMIDEPIIKTFRLWVRNVIRDLRKLSRQRKPLAEEYRHSLMLEVPDAGPSSTRGGVMKISPHGYSYVEQSLKHASGGGECKRWRRRKRTKRSGTTIPERIEEGIFGGFGGFERPEIDDNDQIPMMFVDDLSSDSTFDTDESYPDTNEWFFNGKESKPVEGVWGEAVDEPLVVFENELMDTDSQQEDFISQLLQLENDRQKELLLKEPTEHNYQVPNDQQQMVPVLDPLPKTDTRMHTKPPTPMLLSENIVHRPDRPERNGMVRNTDVVKVYTDNTKAPLSSLGQVISAREPFHHVGFGKVSLKQVLDNSARQPHSGMPVPRIPNIDDAQWELDQTEEWNSRDYEYFFEDC